MILCEDFFSFDPYGEKKMKFTKSFIKSVLKKNNICGYSRAIVILECRRVFVGDMQGTYDEHSISLRSHDLTCDKSVVLYF